MSDKPLPEMTEDELRAEMAEWADQVNTAAGWPSAYFAATQCRAVEMEADRRGIKIINPCPILYEEPNP